MRILQERTEYGDGLYDEWGPFLPEGRPVDTYGWKARDFTQFVREFNRMAKARGDRTRLRSVEIDQEW